jgi:GNAT superfamily N-acetyltransferase
VNTVIRQAELTDLPALCGLVEQYWRFEQIAGFDAARVERLLGDFINDPRYGTAWIATHDRTAVGYILVVHVFSLENGGRTAEIDEFFVAPAARGHGTGALLLRGMEEAVKRAGCVGIALQLGKGNEAGRAFYARRGYAPRSGYDLLEKSL